MGQSDTLTLQEWDLWDQWMRAQRLLAQEIDRRLQSEFGISKPEFSVLVTLLRAPGREMRVADVAPAHADGAARPGGIQRKRGQRAPDRDRADRAGSQGSGERDPRTRPQRSPVLLRPALPRAGRGHPGLERAGDRTRRTRRRAPLAADLAQLRLRPLVDTGGQRRVAELGKQLLARS